MSCPVPATSLRARPLHKSQRTSVLLSRLHRTILEKKNSKNKTFFLDLSNTFLSGKIVQEKLSFIFRTFENFSAFFNFYPDLSDFRSLFHALYAYTLINANTLYTVINKFIVIFTSLARFLIISPYSSPPLTPRSSDRAQDCPSLQITRDRKTIQFHCPRRAHEVSAYY